MSSAAIDSALSFISSIYNASEKLTPAQIVRGTIKARKALIAPTMATALPNDAASVKLAPESKDHAKGEAKRATCIVPAKAPLPLPGTYDAKGFLFAWRKAHGRDEQIAAIAGYVGWDPSGNLGSQEYSARTKAHREIRGMVDTSGPSVAEIRSAKLSAVGYVAGMPQSDQRIMGDLIARQALAVQSIVDYTKDSEDPSKTESERTLAAGLLAIERERLSVIRKDLAKLV